MTQESLQTIYPNIATWIEDSSIEIGTEYNQDIVARAIDEGGVVWEGNKFKDLTQAMNAMEQGIGKWCEENGI